MVEMMIHYLQIKRYLVEDLHYAPQSARETIKKIRHMEPELLHAFIQWFKKHEFPLKPVFGVNIEAMTKYDQLNPVAAFLAADWMAKDPAQAYPILSRAHCDGKPSEEDLALLEQLAKKNGWNLQSPTDESEDQSDIVDPMPANQEQNASK